MRLAARFLILSLAMGTACASKGLYPTWGEQVVQMAQAGGRVDDVSLLLGQSPSRCEPVDWDRPLVGIRVGEKGRVVGLNPNSTASRAGVPIGGRIEKVDGRGVNGQSQAVAALNAASSRMEPFPVVVDEELFVVEPHVPKVEQCYWDVSAGSIARTGGGAYVTPQVGSAHSSGAAYQRFFRAACRVHDGTLASCNANWQQ